MKSEELNRLHRCILIIADEIDRICSANNINYTLIAGSLIGAIRHNGFIPWDDDMDIGMSRYDYERFINICKTELKPAFDLQTVDTDDNYIYGFAKILLKETDLVEIGHGKTKDRKGIFVDIFPFDSVPNKSKNKKKQKFINYILKKMLRQKARIDAPLEWGIWKKFLFHIIDFMNLFVKRDVLVKLLCNNMIKYNSAYTENISNLSGVYGYDRETIPRTFMTTYMYVTFEDRKYLIIKNYHDYLTKIYGDYMQLPPENKRNSHGFQYIEFGPYKMY